MHLYWPRPTSGGRSMSVVWSREVSASRRFQMYYLYGKINRGHRICPLYGGCPLFGGSTIRGFTVYPVLVYIYIYIRFEESRKTSEIKQEEDWMAEDAKF